MQVSDVETHFGQLRYANIVAYSIVLACGLRISESWAEVLHIVTDAIDVGGTDPGPTLARAVIHTIAFTTVAGVTIFVTKRVSEARARVQQNVRRIVSEVRSF